MESIVQIMQEVAANEAGKIYTTELGVVTAISPHSNAADQDNYACSVRLLNKMQADGSDVELPRVPLVTPHIGMANIPAVDDLVALSFVGGDINSPLIIGRLYNDEDRPPVNQEKEVFIQSRTDNGSSVLLQEKAVIIVSSGTDEVKITIEDGGITLDSGSKPVTIKSSGEIKIGDGSSSKITIGGRALAKAVGDGDELMMSTHTHLGNLGAPCPILIPNEKLNSITAKTRNTEVG